MTNNKEPPFSIDSSPSNADRHHIRVFKQSVAKPTRQVKKVSPQDRRQSDEFHFPHWQSNGDTHGLTTMQTRIQNEAKSDH